MFSFITVCDRSDLMVIAIACPVLAWPRECLTTGDDGGLRGRRASTVVGSSRTADAVLDVLPAPLFGSAIRASQHGTRNKEFKMHYVTYHVTCMRDTHSRTLRTWTHMDTNAGDRIICGQRATWEAHRAARARGRAAALEHHVVPPMRPAATARAVGLLGCAAHGGSSPRRDVHGCSSRSQRLQPVRAYTRKNGVDRAVGWRGKGRSDRTLCAKSR